MTRDIAIKMNETFGEVFKLPEPRIQPATETVPGLDGQKMSKSYGNTIDIFGDEKETRKRVMSIVTDSSPVEAPKDPETSTIVQLYALFADEAETAAMKDAFRKGGTGYGEFKKQLAVQAMGIFRADAQTARRNSGRSRLHRSNPRARRDPRERSRRSSNGANPKSSRANGLGGAARITCERRGSANPGTC